MSQLDVAWMAGFAEGEGTIGVYKHKRSGYGYYYEVPLIEIGNTERGLLQPFHKLFGGSLHQVYKKGYPKTGYNANKTYHRWRVTNRLALWAALAFLPHLKGTRRKGVLSIIQWYTSGLHPRGGLRQIIS